MVIRHLLAEGMLAAMVIRHPLVAEGIPAAMVIKHLLVAEGFLAAMVIRHPLVADCILAGVQISQNCAFYSLKGHVTESNPFIVNSTDIYLAAGGDILDACGHPFNVTVTQVQQTHRYICYLPVDMSFLAHLCMLLLCFHVFIKRNQFSCKIRCKQP